MVLAAENEMNISVHPMSTSEITLMVDYFLDSSIPFLEGMGVDYKKLPQKQAWIDLLNQDIIKPVEQKEFYYLIWDLEGKPVGHSNINKIKFGLEAYMHLHLWHPASRTKGLGTIFLKHCIQQYFKVFSLQNLYCEPFSQNPGPNKTLSKLGFQLEKTYETVPGWINYNQVVNRWKLSRQLWQTQLLGG
jgi:RimJ/RimL family protein N-acetyltransferase